NKVTEAVQLAKPYVEAGVEPPPGLHPLIDQSMPIRQSKTLRVWMSYMARPRNPPPKSDPPNSSRVSSASTRTPVSVSTPRLCVSYTGIRFLRQTITYSDGSKE